MKPFVLIWGGGDLASGVALRLYHAGLHLLIIEQEQPVVVRRTVAFAQAVYDHQTQIEEVVGRLVAGAEAVEACWAVGEIPVLVDPQLHILDEQRPVALIDARMRKRNVENDLRMADLIIGLGPGFTVGKNCHAAIETNRGHFLGRVYWEGSPQPATGIPGQVEAYTKERVLRAPRSGIVRTSSAIGERVKSGDEILTVDGQAVKVPFDGLIRGLIQDGLPVHQGMKVGDVDPRPERYRCWTVSEKGLAIGGGVLEALLTRAPIRKRLWDD